METIKWTADPAHSELGFKIKHLMITHVSGVFKQFNVEAETTGHDFTTSKVKLNAAMDSIDTHNEQRDAHLRNSDFFDADNHPEFNFLSTHIDKIDNETFTMHGNLTMRGVTRPVKLNVEYSAVTKDPWGMERAGFTVTGKINRSDWGITFNSVLETGGLGLGEEVKVFAEVQLVKQQKEVLV